MECKLDVLMGQHDPRLTQKQLATAVGLSTKTIHRLYNSRPMTARIDPDTVEKICAYFGCNINDLFILGNKE